MFKTKLLVVSVVLLLALASACGGSSNGEDDASSSSTDIQAGQPTEEQLEKQPAQTSNDESGAKLEQSADVVGDDKTPEQNPGGRAPGGLAGIFSKSTETGAKPVEPTEVDKEPNMVDVQVGQRYESGTRVNFPTIGVSFVVPAGWFGIIPEGSETFLLGADERLGGGIALSHQVAHASDLVTLLNQPIALELGATIEVQGQAEIDGSMIRARISLSDGTDTLPGHLLAVFRQGGGGLVFVGFGPEEDDPYQSLVGDLASSFSTTEIQAAQVPPGPTDPAAPNVQAIGVNQSAEALSPIAQEWDQRLRGMKATYISSYSSGGTGGGFSTRVEYFFCRDGRFSFVDSSSIASADSFSFSGGGDLSSSGQGRWKIVTEGDSFGIELTLDDGTSGVARLDFYDGETYINGERHFVTDDNPYC